MKKLLPFFILLFLCNSMSAQNVEYTKTEETLREQIDVVLENLDFSEATTGYLLENTVPLYPLERFDGFEVSDSTIVSIVDLNLMYDMMRDAATTNVTLPPYSNIENAAENITKSDPIPIVIFKHRYNKFKKNAVSQNLLTIANDQLFDVVNRPVSPYLENTLFVAATMLPVSDTLNITFKLESDFIIDNFDTPIDEILIDFDDGNGFQNMNISDVINVSYSEYSEKIIIIKELGINPRETQTRISLVDPESLKAYELTPDETISFDIDGDGKDEADVNIFFASCPQQANAIRKPFIYIQGFNASKGLFDLGFQEVFEKKFDVDFSLDGISATTLNEELSNAGYDFLYIDFKNGAADFRDNAAVVEAIINFVNTEKADNGSTEKNILMGSSAGGMIGQFALRTMEVAEIDHEVETYFTYDAQLRGANIALSVQALLDHFANYKVLPFLKLKEIPIAGISFEGGVVGVVAGALSVDIGENPLKTFEDAMKSEGAKQFVAMNMFDPTFMTSNGIHGQGFVNFFAELDALGELEVEHIVLSNGSQIGEGQIAQPGDKFFSIDVNGLNGLLAIANVIFKIGDIEVPEFVSVLFGGGFNINADLHMVADNSSTFQTVYDGGIGIKIFLIDLRQQSKLKVKEKPAYDTSPGGMAGPEKDKVEFFEPLVDFNHFSFSLAPTVSVLGIDTYDFFMDVSNNQNVTNAVNTHIDGFAASDRISTQLDIDQHNQLHGSMNDKFGITVTNKLVSRDAVAGIPIDPNSVIPTIDNLVFNIGEAAATAAIQAAEGVLQKATFEITTNIDIINDGALWINRIDFIGFTNTTTNPMNATPSHLDVKIGSGTLCGISGKTINVKNGTLLIGDWTGATKNTSDFYVSENGNVVVHQNGILDISNSSKLIIQDGGEVTIQSGGLLKGSWNTQVIVEAGGILRVENNGQLRPSNNAQIWVQPGGQLILEDGAKVQLWAGSGPDAVENAPCNIKLGGPILDPDNTPDVGELVLNGEFEYSGTGYFDIHPNANVELVGDTDFKIDGHGKGYRFLKLSNGGSLRLNKNQCKLWNGEVEYTGSGTINLTGTASGRFFKTEFTGHSNATGITGEGCQFIYVNQCDFNNFEVGISATLLTDLFINGNVVVFDSHFKDCGTGIYGEELDNIRVTDTKMESTSPIYSDFGVDLVYVDNSYFTDIDFDNLLNGIRTLGTSDIVMNRGIIQNNRTGIHILDQQGSGPEIRTVDLIGQATLKNNDVGIFAVADLSLPDGPFPMITLNCARLDENKIGIRGRDLVLNIDAGSDTAPNYFKIRELSNQSFIFQLCYFNLEVEAVEATNNFWEGNIYRNINQVNSSGPLGTFCQMEEGQILGGSPDNGNVPLNIEPQLTTEPDGCGLSGNPNGPSPGGGGGDDKTVLETPTDEFWEKVNDCHAPQQQKIYDTYLQAYDLYLTEIAESTADHRNSQAEFRKIAVLTAKETREFSMTCKMLIEKSRSRAGIPSSDYVNENTTKISTGCSDLVFEINSKLAENGVEQIKVWYSEAGKFDGGRHPLESQPNAAVSTFGLNERAIAEWDNPNFKLDNLSESTTYYFAYELLKETDKSLGIYYPTTTLSTDDCPSKFYDDSGVYFGEDCQITGIWWSFQHGNTDSYFEVIETAEFTENPEKSGIKTTKIPNTGDKEFSYFVDRENLASKKTQWVYMRLVDAKNGATLDWMVWDLSANPCEDGVTGRSNTYMGDFLEKEDYLGNGAIVYPNPVEHLLYLKTEQDRFNEFQIIDVVGTYWQRGNLELDATETKIDVSLLPPGVYMIQLKSKGTNWKTIRFVVSE
jgi:hypothetical protein